MTAFGTGRRDTGTRGLWCPTRGRACARRGRDGAYDGRGIRCEMTPEGAQKDLCEQNDRECRCMRPDQGRAPLDSSDWHGSGMETVWAEPVGPGRYRIDNSPFYFFDLSYRDIIEAEHDENGQLRFRQVHERGGHSTYRIMRSEDTSETFDAAWQRLHALGCTSEGGPGRLVSVDVPPSTDIYDVYELLEAGKRSGVWDFEEGHCGHPLAPDRRSTQPRGRGRHV
ncbi:DUF4265 domain-containing protein [Nannocystis pusilla]|uniref:DUF4265 domain-containing protein n=1 Tax=Nannocystis pusilla TaxID=889268 RepID=UPI003B80A3AE